MLIIVDYCWKKQRDSIKSNVSRNVNDSTDIGLSTLRGVLNQWIQIRLNTHSETDTKSVNNSLYLVAMYEYAILIDKYWPHETSQLSPAHIRVVCAN